MGILAELRTIFIASHTSISAAITTSSEKQSRGSRITTLGQTDMDSRHMKSTSFADLSDVTVVTTECDPLLDEGVDYARALEAAGVRTAYREYEAILHGFNNRTGLIDAAKDSLDFGAAQINESFARISAQS